MPFWSGEKLARRLPGLITPFDHRRIDCASYRLTLGPEVFVTTDLRLEDSPDQGLKLDLKPGDQCRIPPGQFAFLLTEENVEIPSYALGFISIRARYKFKGLVNVSGFHVDPGWKGRLVFGIYNAGPSPIVLSRGSEIFLIWYADLDRHSKITKRIDVPQMSIDPQLIEGMGGQVFSPIALSKDVDELKEKAIESRDEFNEKNFNLRVELVELRSEHNFYKRVLWAALAIVLTVAAREAYQIFFSARQPQLVIRERVVDVPDTSGVQQPTRQIGAQEPQTVENRKGENKKADPKPAAPVPSVEKDKQPKRGLENPPASAAPAAKP
jgi:dCTP deaminase